MKRSQLFVTSSKQTEADLDCRSAELAVRAGLIHNYGSGIFGFTHLGKRVLDNVESVIREEMDKIGQEVEMNLLQNAKLWEKSGRWDSEFKNEVVLNLENRDGKAFFLAATHEEAVVELVRKHIRSYRDLEFTVYQIGKKVRDDRARNGLLRTKEFVMKDAYSFHRNQDNLDEKYNEIVQVYKKIFDRLGLDYSIVSASNEGMGGSGSHEFQAESEIGSDTYLKCSNCIYGTRDMDAEECSNCASELEEATGIEIGHTFKLGTRYSSSMDLKFDTEDGENKEVIMGCYGIGVTRLIAALLEQNNDQKGITWNQEVSAFDVSVIAARHEKEAQEKAEEVHERLEENGIDALLYTGRSAGEAFHESDLFGIGLKLIVGRTWLDSGKLELEDREGVKRKASLEEVISSM